MAHSFLNSLISRDRAMVNFVVYEGEKFTIEWYMDDRGKSPAKEYFEKLDFDRKKKFDYLIRCMADMGSIQNEEKFRHEGDQIYAFKPSPDRFLCFFFRGSKIIITNAFEKKARKLPVREKERALFYKEDYTKRVNGGTYYGKEKNSKKKS